MTLGDNDLVFRAKALAQAHPLTALARRFSDRVAEQERAGQPMAEIAIWATAGLLNGYCVRRVEEDEAGLRLEPVPDFVIPLDDLDAVATRIAGDLRGQSGPPGRGASGSILGDEQAIVDGLDRIVAGEVERRLHNLSDEVDAQAWEELGDYMAFWVVKGYALRAAEAEVGGVLPTPASTPAAGAGRVR